MTQQILFLIMILIGAYYAQKYGNKAKCDIEKYKHLIDNSNYIEQIHTCCDDYSPYNYCPICGTKLK